VSCSWTFMNGMPLNAPLLHGKPLGRSRAMSAIRKPHGIAGNDRAAPIETAVLAISAFEEDLAALARMFQGSQWKLFAARNCPEGFGFLRERGIPIVIAEKDAPGGGWKTILHEIQQYTPVPKLIVTYRFSEARS